MDHAGGIADTAAPARGRRILVLLTDAFGGHGGIALYNRDVLRALCEDPDTAEVVALPRLARLPLSGLPDKLTFDLSALGGTMAYLRALGRHLMGDLRATVYRLAPPRVAEDLEIVMSVLGLQGVLIGAASTALDLWIDREIGLPWATWDRSRHK